MLPCTCARGLWPLSHIDDVDVILFACWALVELAAGEDDEKNPGFDSIVDAVLDALDRHVKNGDVQRFVGAFWEDRTMVAR